MPYPVIKTVKGRPYLYLQESYWDHGQVRTRSEYIGPIDPTTGEVHTSKDVFDPLVLEPFLRQRLDVWKTLSLGFSEVQPDQPSAPRPPPASSPQPPRLHIPALPSAASLSRLRIDLDTEAYRLSRHSLEQDYRQCARRLLALGIPEERWPRLRLTSGRTLRIRRQRLEDAWVVQAPWAWWPTRPDREKVREAFRQALGRVEIEALRRGRPDRYAQLSLGFSESHKQTSALLFRYLWHVRGSSYRLLALWFFSLMHPVGSVPAERLGLSHYGSRRSWEDEAAALYAEVLRYGRDKLRSRIGANLARARATVRQIAAQGRLRRCWRRGELKRAEARIALLQAQQRKLALLLSVFPLG